MSATVLQNAGVFRTALGNLPDVRRPSSSSSQIAPSSNRSLCLLSRTRHGNAARCSSKRGVPSRKTGFAKPVNGGFVKQNTGVCLRRGATRAAQGESSGGMGVATEEDEFEEEEYTEEEQRRDMAAIRNVLSALRTKRDMPFNEVKLTIMIEDPRMAEQREKFGIEDDSGVSRDELAAALVDVNEGRVPEDLYVLRELTKEMLKWPNLDSPYFKTTDIGVDRRVAADRLAWDAIPELDELQEKKEIGEGNPVVGYGLLYGISGIPIIIGAAVVGILFFNSFK